MANRFEFYQLLASIHHELYFNWGSFMDWQAAKIMPLLSGAKLQILDASCSIGTQLIPFTTHGHIVTGIDISPLAVSRARLECLKRGMGNIEVFEHDFFIPFSVSKTFDLIFLMDNAISHTENEEEMVCVLTRLKGLLNPGGEIILGIRDYTSAVLDHPNGTAPAFYRYGEQTRIVHQVWDWIDDCSYRFHLYITTLSKYQDTTQHLSAIYSAYLPTQIENALKAAGYKDAISFSPNKTEYHQWLIKGTV